MFSEVDDVREHKQVGNKEKRQNNDKSGEVDIFKLVMLVRNSFQDYLATNGGEYENVGDNHVDNE